MLMAETAAPGELTRPTATENDPIKANPTTTRLRRPEIRNTRLPDSRRRVIPNRTTLRLSGVNLPATRPTGTLTIPRKNPATGTLRSRKAAKPLAMTTAPLCPMLALAVATPTETRLCARIQACIIFHAMNPRLSFPRSLGAARALTRTPEHPPAHNRSRSPRAAKRAPTVLRIATPEPSSPKNPDARKALTDPRGFLLGRTP